MAQTDLKPRHLTLETRDMSVVVTRSGHAITFSMKSFGCKMECIVTPPMVSSSSYSEGKTFAAFYESIKTKLDTSHYEWMNSNGEEGMSFDKNTQILAVYVCNPETGSNSYVNVSLADHITHFDVLATFQSLMHMHLNVE